MGIEPGKTVTDAILACDHPKGQHAKLLEEVEVCEVCMSNKLHMYIHRWWHVWAWYLCSRHCMHCLLVSIILSIKCCPAPAPPPGRDAGIAEPVC